MQERFVGRNVRHRFAIMGIADIASGIYHTIQRHTSKLEKVDFLPIGPRHRMIWVRHADEWDPFLLPIFLKDRQGVGSHSQNRGAAPRERFISITQARQLRAAVRSHETAKERKHDRLATKIRKTDRPAADILQFKVWRQLAGSDQFTHFGSVLLPLSRSHRTSSR